MQIAISAYLVQNLEWKLQWGAPVGRAHVINCNHRLLYNKVYPVLILEPLFFEVKSWF